MKRAYLMALCLFACSLAGARLAPAADVPALEDPPRVESRQGTLRDSAGIELIRVEPGEYLMGGSEPAEQVVQRFPGAGVSAAEMADEYPRHRVRITRPFLLGRFEVTVGQFRRFVDDTGYRTEAERDGTGGWGYSPETGKNEGRRPLFNWKHTGYPQTDEHPVVNVSYNDALAFLGWRSAREGMRYRLPTEAEWEYANRAGSGGLYGNADDPRSLPAFARAIDVLRQPEFRHIHELTIRPDDPSAFPLPVGSRAANAWGFHDLHGNVWEWVADRYGEHYYSASPVDDPQGPASGHLRVRRGGGWNSFPFYLRSSFRNINTPGSRCLNLGFRVARDL